VPISTKREQAASRLSGRLPHTTSSPCRRAKPQCCLTPRSTGRTTAGQLGPGVGTRYIVATRAKPPCRGAPVNSNVSRRSRRSLQCGKWRRSAQLVQCLLVTAGEGRPSFGGRRTLVFACTVLQCKSKCARSLRASRLPSRVQCQGGATHQASCFRCARSVGQVEPFAQAQWVKALLLKGR
jgi:hypothetical protein